MSKKKFPPVFEVAVESFLPSGEARGKYDGREVSVYGAVPGDKVLVRPLKVNRRRARAAMVDVLEASPLRREPRDVYYMNASPWQVLPEASQWEHKRELTGRVFKDKAGQIPRADVPLEGVEPFWHYRNKMEFCFTEDEKGLLCLGVFQRFRHNRTVPVEESALAHERINECGRAVIGRMREEAVPLEHLKSVIFRYSYHDDQCLAALFVKDRDFACFDVEAPVLAGWQIVYSDPLSPASKTTEVLHRRGRDTLHEEVGGLVLKYVQDSFFQVHVPGFTRLLEWIRPLVRGGRRLVDLYGGVGTIGLFLAGDFGEAVIIDSDQKAVSALRENARSNGVTNVLAAAKTAEKTDLALLLGGCSTLVVDPPRSGLHPKVTRAIIRSDVRRFIYISCNPLTQAQDFAELNRAYDVIDWRLFDLYPQTPHVESVLVMEKKSHQVTRSHVPW